jgi:hypothetical protein
MSYAPNQILRWRQLHQLRSLLKNTSDEVALGRLSEDVGSFLEAQVATFLGPCSRYEQRS